MKTNPSKNAAAKSLPKVSHYGTIKIDNLAIDCVVLEGGTRGYIQNQMLQTLGFKGHGRMPRFRRFLEKIPSNALDLLDKSDAPVVVIPSGGHANFLPIGLLSAIVEGVMDAFASGTLHTQRKQLVKPCLAISKALHRVGEIALSDEVTGYQYQRAPDALQQTAQTEYIDTVKILKEFGFACSMPEDIAIKKDMAQFLDVPESTLDSFLRKHKEDIRPIKLDRATIRAGGYKASNMNGYHLDDVSKIALSMNSIVGLKFKKKVFGQIGPFAQPQTPVEIQWREVLTKVFAGLGLRCNHQIGPYKVDFFVAKLMLVLECNGYCHKYYDPAKEAAREKFILQRYSLIRFHHQISWEALVNAILQAKQGQITKLYDLNQLGQEMPFGLNATTR